VSGRPGAIPAKEAAGNVRDASSADIANPVVVDDRRRLLRSRTDPPDSLSRVPLFNSHRKPLLAEAEFRQAQTWHHVDADTTRGLRPGVMAVAFFASIE
jgi:hypothetical protein